MLATQNPIEQEGTYPLPEAQVDRFMLKLRIGYPSPGEERQILDLMARTSGGAGDARPVVEPKDDPGGPRGHQRHLRGRQGEGLHRGPGLRDARTRSSTRSQVRDFIQLGASPRATISLTLAAKAHAFLHGRGYVTPQDVKSIGDGRAAPPGGDHLRGRGGGEDERDDHPEDP